MSSCRTAMLLAGGVGGGGGCYQKNSFLSSE